MSCAARSRADTFVFSCFREFRVVTGAALVCCTTACGAPLLKLPSGPGAPAADAADAFNEATSACRAVDAITAEVAASGKVGGQRLRGHILVGLAAPASARLEAVAPAGQPIFIFVARNNDATLLLPGEDRVLEHGPAKEVLEAVTGVPVDAGELRHTLTGCVAAETPPAGKSLGADWRLVTLGAADVYLQHDPRAARWQLVAAVHRDGGEWRAEYRDFDAGLPRSVHLTSADGSRFDLSLRLSQVAVNETLGPEVFLVERAALGRADVPRRAETSRVRAFAKINLSLRVLGTRADGYHELRTIFQSIALHDTITVRAARGPFRLTCDDPGCPADDTNLIWRAAERVWRAAGRRGAPRDVAVDLEKRIPLNAGLGGGSSDAAAALRALGRMWRVNEPVLRAIGGELGADAPYFFEGGTVLGLERGDLLFPMLDQPKAWVVLVLPSFGVPTRQAFAWWDQCAGTQRLDRETEKAQREISSTICNRRWSRTIPKSAGA